MLGEDGAFAPISLLLVVLGCYQPTGLGEKKTVTQPATMCYSCVEGLCLDAVETIRVFSSCCSLFISKCCLFHHSVFVSKCCYVSVLTTADGRVGDGLRNY